MSGDTPTPNLLYLWSVRILGAVAGIRPEERRNTFGAFLTLLGFMAGHALLETARDALFLASLPASLLPWVYLTIAAIALLLARRRPGILSRFSTRNELSAWLALSGVVTLAFWGAVHVAGRWVFYALYAWSGVLATLVVVRFWTVLGDRFTVTQAKRLFAVIGSGSVLGAILGSGLARLLTALLPAQHVVLAAAAVFLASSLGPGLMEPDPRPPGRRVSRVMLAPWDLGQAGRLIWGQPYLRRVAVVVLVSTICFTLVDFVFKSTVARLVADEALGEFFSSVYFSLNILSLAVQVVAVGWLLRRVGVNGVQAVMPALLLAGAVGFAATGALVAVLLLKGADGSLRHSLYRTGTELLYVPLAAEVRARVKAVIDVLGHRGGQALASLLILLGLTLTTREVVFAVVAAAGAGVWLFLVFDLKKHYLDVFRETLEEEITATSIEFPALDLASLETLVATLNDPDDRKVVAALDLLAAQGKARVIPALILYHPSPEVVVHAIDVFIRSERDDCLAIAERLSVHPDPGVRAASLRARAVLAPEEVALRAGQADPAQEVRATALAGLAAGGWLEPDAARRELQRTVEAGAPEARLALARTIRYLPAPAFEEVLVRLARAPEVGVQTDAIRAMRDVRSPLFLSVLIALLPQRTLREEVRATLVALGATALARLGAALEARELPHAIRRHLPHTISAFGSVQAAAILLRHLPVESDGMIRFKILRALGRLRSEHPGIPLDERLLAQAIDQNLSTAFRFLEWRRALEWGARERPERRTEVARLLIALLRDKEIHALERLFRLLNLQANNEDFVRIWRGLQSSRRESRAGSRELVENLVFPPVRAPLLTLIDELFEATESSAGPAQDREVAGYEGVLGELIDSGTESLSCLAAYHAAELTLTGVRERVQRCVVLSDFHAEVVQQAVDIMSQAPAREVGGGR